MKKYLDYPHNWLRRVQNAACAKASDGRTREKLTIRFDLGTFSCGWGTFPPAVRQFSGVPNVWARVPNAAPRVPNAGPRVRGPVIEFVAAAEKRFRDSKKVHLAGKTFRYAVGI